MKKNLIKIIEEEIDYASDKDYSNLEQMDKMYYYINRFIGRKIGETITETFDEKLLKTLKKTFTSEFTKAFHPDINIIAMIKNILTEINADNLHRRGWDIVEQSKSLIYSCDINYEAITEQRFEIGASSSYYIEQLAIDIIKKVTNVLNSIDDKIFIDIIAGAMSNTNNLRINNYVLY